MKIFVMTLCIVNYVVAFVSMVCTLSALTTQDSIVANDNGITVSNMFGKSLIVFAISLTHSVALSYVWM